MSAFIAASDGKPIRFTRVYIMAFLNLYIPHFADYSWDFNDAGSNTAIR